MSSSCSDVEMTEDKILDILRQTRMDATTKLASRAQRERERDEGHNNGATSIEIVK